MKKPNSYGMRLMNVVYGLLSCGVGEEGDSFHNL